ncbi:hypothetical protein RMR10_022865 [Agrobacterium rosae]|uniref:hypothetical protein n=1 Tax=Agrobacterium rosae TaxID=1972867 RepID=UPI002A11E2F2|nr:hypothetical protein [Agrobacterium rosae]MDX8315183.1 hypothetical protein [Agrobacterium rosae]
MSIPDVQLMTLLLVMIIVTLPEVRGPTGSYEQASYAIQDTPDVVQQHYSRFLPQDKAALAAKILNQVWEAA